jgi:hypothetical protein
LHHRLASRANPTSMTYLNCLNFVSLTFCPPNNRVEVDDIEKAKSIVKLIDVLEDLDDVQNVTANFEMSENCYPVLKAK